MRGLKIEEIYASLASRSIYKNGIFKGIFIGDAYTYIKNFCEHYISNSLPELSNILEQCNESSQDNEILDEKITPFEDLLISNYNADLSLYKTKHNIFTKLINIDDISHNLIKLIFTKNIRENIKNIIIPMMLLKNVILINIPPDTNIDMPIS
jgi:hypothetical protein